MGWGSCLQGLHQVLWSLGAGATLAIGTMGRHCLLGLRMDDFTPGSLCINFQSQNFERLEGTLEAEKEKDARD